MPLDKGTDIVRPARLFKVPYSARRRCMVGHTRHAGQLTAVRHSSLSAGLRQRSA